MTGRRRFERGQVTVMIVGFFLVVGLLTAVVVDASAAYLRHQSLNSLADGAALAATDGLRGAQVYRGGLEGRAVIDPELAERYVALYLAEVDADRRYPGLQYSVRSSGRRVVVEIRAQVSLPLPPPGWDDSTVITGGASAVVPVM